VILTEAYCGREVQKSFEHKRNVSHFQTAGFRENIDMVANKTIPVKKIQM